MSVSKTVGGGSIPPLHVDLAVQQSGRLVVSQEIAGFEKFRTNEFLMGREWLEKTLQPDDIVVTHMLPSHRCVHPKYWGKSSNAYFVTDCHKLIEERRPKAGLYGHTHEYADFTLGATRMLCRPRSYPFEHRDKYDPNVVHVVD